MIATRPAMTMSVNGRAVLCYFERFASKAYPDPGSPMARARAAGRPCNGLSGSPWTIFWGDTGPDVCEGMTGTQAQGDARLARRLTLEFGPMLTRALLGPTTQGQFDALCDLLYNVGPGIQRERDGVLRLRSGAPSTVLRAHNAGMFELAADAFLAWDKAGGDSMLGLRRRRAADRALYLGKTGQQAIEIGAATK